MCIMIMKCRIALDMEYTWALDHAQREGGSLCLRSCACHVAAYVHGGPGG